MLFFVLENANHIFFSPSTLIQKNLQMSVKNNFDERKSWKFQSKTWLHSFSLASF